MPFEVAGQAHVADRPLPVADDAWGNDYPAPPEQKGRLANAPPPPVDARAAPVVRGGGASAAETAYRRAAAAGDALAPAGRRRATRCPRLDPTAPPADAPPPAPEDRDRVLPTLRGLCLTALAQHVFWLAEVAAAGGDGDALRRALPSPDDRLVLAAAARGRGALDGPLFMALADPAWPVLCVDSLGAGRAQPPARAVVAAARAGLLRGVRSVEWTLPCEGRAAGASSAAAGAPTGDAGRAGGKARLGAGSGATAAAAAPAAPTACRSPLPPPPLHRSTQQSGGAVDLQPLPPPPASILLPAEASAVVRALAAHCPVLERLSLRRADPERWVRPAVVAAVSRALLAAALPKGICGEALPGRSRGRDEKGGEDGLEAAAAAAAETPAAAAAAAVVASCWEEAIADDGGAGGDAATAAAEHAHEHVHEEREARAAFAPSLCLLRWQDLPEVTAGAIVARCPRIVVDRRDAEASLAALDAPWMAALAPGWDDRGAERAERQAEERRRREAARLTKLFVAQSSLATGGGGGGGGGDDRDEEGDQEGGLGQCPDAACVGEATPAAAAAAPREPEGAGEQGDGELSIAERFRRAYEERAARLRRIEAAKEEHRRRRAVRASPGLALMERWLDEAV